MIAKLLNDILKAVKELIKINFGGEVPGVSNPSAAPTPPVDPGDPPPPPVIIPPERTYFVSGGSIAEKNAPGSQVGIISAFGDQPITFSFEQGGIDNNRFTLTTGGVLTVNQTVLYNNNKSFKIKVRATNGGGFFVKDFTINVIQDPSARTATFIRWKTDGRILEGTAAGTVVGELISDATGTLTYNLIPENEQNQNSDFVLDGNKVVSNSVFSASDGNKVIDIEVTGETGVSFEDRLTVFVNEIIVPTPTTWEALINIGPAQPNKPAPPNNHDDPAVGFETAIEDSNGVEVATLENLDEMGSNDQGAPTGDDSGVYPDVYIYGYFFAVETSKRMLLKGLDDDNYYNFTFFGSRSNPDRGTNFRIGSVTKLLDVSFNSDRTITFYNVRPTNGEIDIAFSNGIRDVGYFNAMEVKSFAEEQMEPVNPPPPPPPPPTAGGTSEIQTIDTTLPDGLQRGKFMPPANYEMLWDNSVKAEMLSLIGQDIHSREADSIKNDNAGPYRALRYKLYGNVSDGVAALNWMAGRVNTSISAGSVNTYGSGHDAWNIGIIHSWCKGLYSRSDTPSKSDMVNKIARLCWDSNFDTGDSPIFPNKNIDDIFGNNRAGGNVRFITTHHGTHISGLFVMATAIADDEPRPYRQIRDAIIEEGVLAKWAMNRGLLNGPQYGIARGSTIASIEMLLQDIAKKNGQSNTRYFPKECFQDARAFMYCTRPDGITAKHGDLFHYFPFPSYAYTRWIVMTAVAAEDREAIDFAYRIAFNRVEMNVPDRNLYYVLPTMLMLAQKPLPPKDFKTLPLSAKFDYPSGMSVRRSGWDIRVGNSGSNDRLFVTWYHAIVGNHAPHSIGYFYYNKGAIEAPNGYYGADYGLPHITDFIQQSVAYNTLLSQNSDFLMPVRNGGNVKIGGIKFVDNPRNLNDVLNGRGSYVYDSLKVSRSHTDDSITTVLIDTSEAEDNRYAKTVRRLILNLDTGFSDIPMLVFTQDFFENKVDDTTNVTLCQSIDDVSVNQSNNTFVITNDRKPISSLSYRGQAKGWEFGSGKVNIWTGWHTSRSTTGVPNGTEAPPQTKASWQIPYIEEGGKRVDIRTNDQDDAEHFTLRAVAETGTSYPNPSHSKVGDLRIITMLGITIVAAEKHAEKSGLTFSVPSNNRVIVLCLTPGKYKDQTGKNYTVKSGFLFDERLNAGTYTLSPQ